jgi:hypothetical protein
MAIPLAWIEEQFRLMGRRDAHDLAIEFLASYQGTAVLTHALREPALLGPPAKVSRLGADQAMSAHISLKRASLDPEWRGPVIMPSTSAPIARPTGSSRQGRHNSVLGIIATTAKAVALRTNARGRALRSNGGASCRHANGCGDKGRGLLEAHLHTLGVGSVLAGGWCSSHFEDQLANSAWVYEGRGVVLAHRRVGPNDVHA